MARRRELKGIASGIAESFNSRNNDVDGYWGVGKLYKLVEDSKKKEVEVDLINLIIVPHSTEFNSLMRTYQEMFFELLQRHIIPAEWIVSVKITACFETVIPEKQHYWRGGLGRPCLITCVITDDNGRTHLAQAYNNCLPHDPNRERKRWAY